jgi:hypothetical protein
MTYDALSDEYDGLCSNAPKRIQYAERVLEVTILQRVPLLTLSYLPRS